MERLGTSKTLTMEVMFHNDDEEYSSYMHNEVTPEQRYKNMLKWVREQLALLIATRKTKVKSKSNRSK